MKAPCARIGVASTTAFFLLDCATSGATKFAWPEIIFSTSKGTMVATIVPFDVDRIASGKTLTIAPAKSPAVVAAKPAQKVVPVDVEPVSHYAENVTPIGKIEWRKRAQVQGRVTSIKAAATGASPVVSVEIWDETGGVTLQFLGRREISGLEVGSQMRAEGMVGEDNGNLIILNPSYEIVI